MAGLPGSRYSTETSSQEDGIDLATLGAIAKKRRHRKKWRLVRQYSKAFLCAFIFTFGIFAAAIIVALLVTKSEAVEPSRSPSQESDNGFPHRSISPTNVPIAPTDTPSWIPSTSSVPTTTVAPSASPSTGAPSEKPSSEPSSAPSNAPSEFPTASPSTSYPSASPSTQPTPAPTTTFAPSNAPSIGIYPKTTVLESRNALQRGDFVSSPSGEFKVGLSILGEFVLQDSAESLIWKANVTDAFELFLQLDGNLIMRDEENNSLWSTKTSKNDGARFVIDDGGIMGLVYGFGAFAEQTYVWMQGIPRGEYSGPPQGSNLKYPIRGAFYYPWYPETWTVSTGDLARFEPDIGYYHSGDPAVVNEHIDSLEYGKIDLGIFSWFGIDTNNDIARISLLLDETQTLQANVKWAVYYEMMTKERTEDQIREDLDYIKKWFAWHPAYAHIDGKPIVFVYQQRGCDIVRPWMDASQGDWYVVPKVFDEFKGCPSQPKPGSWHQYAPARPIQRYDKFSYTISPGFWHANETTPRLPRLNETEWCQNIQDMVDSGDPWQLITSFNEAGEGTIVEPSAANWPSQSGYGTYLDCLHKIF
jgi:hypothetical protein